VLGLALSCVLGAAIFGFGKGVSPLRDTVAALHPHPRMLAFSSDLGVGHPLVRQLGGTWVSRVCSNWKAATAKARLETEPLDQATRSRLTQAIRQDLQVMADDIVHHQPDIVLVDAREFDWQPLIDGNPALRSALAVYQDRGTSGGVQVLKRM
jgi:hypothetical protein